MSKALTASAAQGSKEAGAAIQEIVAQLQGPTKPVKLSLSQIRFLGQRKEQDANTTE